MQSKIQELKEQLAACPDGKLICIKNGKYSKWYRSLNGNYSYIPKKKRPLAEQLAVKKYLSLKLEDLTREHKAIQSYLKHYNSTEEKAAQLLSDPSYHELLTNYFSPQSEELTTWLHAPYDKNRSHPEHLIHKSISGNTLRSKSEAIIDMTLYQFKIPYRYECKLCLGGITLYPDFTIKHPHTGEIYYWEHCGMMDNPSYLRSHFKKIQTYTENGIIPTINLITTYETSEHPLKTEKVSNIIQEYFV